MRKLLTLSVIALLLPFALYAQTRLTDLNTSGTGIGGDFKIYNNKLYFNGLSQTSGAELYSVDINDSVQLVADIQLGALGANPHSMEAYGNSLYFIATDSSLGDQLYKLTGSSLQMIPNQHNFTSMTLVELQPFQNKILIVANDNELLFGRELWFCDTAGTHTNILTDINPGIAGARPESFMEFNNTLYFLATHAQFGTELATYDGSAFAFVQDLRPGSQSSLFPQEMFEFNGKLYFIANDGTNGVELYEYDAVNPPVRIDLNPGGGSYPWAFSNINNQLFFVAKTDQQNNHKYFMKYDGVNSPVIVDSFEIETTSGFVTFKDAIYFVNDDGVHGKELWRFDGQSAPTMVADINVGAADALGLFSTTIIYNGRLYFRADDGTHGLELWEYDGVNPPQMLNEIRTGAGHPGLVDFTVYNNSLYFRADDGVHGLELWKYTSSPASGTKEPEVAAQLINIFPNPTNDVVNITSKTTEIRSVRVLNKLGQTLQYHQGAAQQVNIHSLSSGIYWLQIETENGMVNKAVIRQ